MIPELLTSLAKRIRSPWLAQQSDDLFEHGAQVAKNSLPELADYGGQMPLVKWLKATSQDVGSYWDRLTREIHSPDMISDHAAWQNIIRVASENDITKNKFLEPIVQAANKAKGGIRSGSDSSINVFDALEDPMKALNLSKEERNLYDFQKGQYDFLFRHRLRVMSGDEKAYNNVIRLTQREVTPEEYKSLPENIKEAYDWATSKITDYAPRLWKREDLQDMLEENLNSYVAKYGGTKDPKKQAKFAERIKEIEASLARITGGEPLKWDMLPREFLFRHEMVRKGEKGYQHDSVKSFNNYLFSLAKKMFDEPAVQQMVELYKELPFELRPYAKKFIRDYAGYNTKGIFDDIASKVAGFEYARTLGLNPRSPLVNLTQQFNTLVDAGPKWSMKGYLRMFTKEGGELWDKSGLAAEVPAAFSEELSPSAGKIEQLKRILGFMFNTAEKFNRKHAFLSYLSKYEEALPAEEAIKKAIEGVHKSQFQYGRTGMPMVLRRPAGKLIGQFTSYSIKQVEFLQKLARENPAKLAAWIGGSAGMNYTLQEVAGLDLSNALGFGINFAEALETLKSASKGELDEALAHGRLTFAQGGGILPTGPGPAVSGLYDIAKSISKGEEIGSTILRQLMPIEFDRVESLLESLLARTKIGGEKLPILSRKGEFKYEEPLSESLIQTFGPRLTSRTKKESAYYTQSVMDQLEGKRKRIIAEAIVAGNSERAEKLITKWNVVPTRDTIYELLLSRMLPREQRKKWILSAERQRRREEEAE